MRELTNVEGKILDKALYLIGKIGSFNVPIRAIAKEAKCKCECGKLLFSVQKMKCYVM